MTATGMDTEMGRIAQLLKSTEERKTPLQVSLDQFGRKLSIIILVICAALFAVAPLPAGMACAIAGLAFGSMPMIQLLKWIRR